MEDTMEEENGREAKLKAEITRWLIFFGVAIMLSVMTWLGWSLTNRKNPITSFTTVALKRYGCPTQLTLELDPFKMEVY